MDPDKAFEQVMSVLRRDPRVGETKMFGARGAKVGDKSKAKTRRPRRSGR